MEKELIETTLGSIGDAVIATDANGCITFMNPEAERLTGWTTAEASGRALPEVFCIINESTRQTLENPVEKVIKSGTVVGLANHSILISRRGAEIPIDDSAAPIRKGQGPLLGVVLVFRDVTQQRRADEAKAHLAAIVEHSGDVIITKDLNGIIRSWNASAERLFGYRAGEIIGKHVTTIFPSDRLTEEDHILGRLREGRPVEHLETVRVAKDGKRIPVSVYVSPMKDAEGRIIGASKVIHDITELVAAREALKQEKEVLSTTLASIGDGVIVTDAKGHVTFLNAEAQRLTKWQSTEAAGRPLTEIFHIVNEESRLPVENPVDKVLRLGTIVGLANHTVLIAKDGAEMPIDDSAAPIRRADGPFYGVVLVFRDFTEHKEMEAELHALALLPAQNPAPILRVAGDGNLLYANPVSKQVLKSDVLTVGRLSPEPLRSFAAEALQGAKPIQRELTADGRVYLMTVTPVGEFGYANFYGTDVTERREAEKALQLAHTQLEDRAVHLENLVSERTKELSGMVNELQHVSYAIVHDMRAPLRAMNTFAVEIMEGLASTGASAELKDFCQRIITAAARLDKLIQDTLGYTKAVLQEFPLQPVDLSRLVPGLIESYPNLQPQNAEIMIENHLPVVLGEESLLTQCFSNLLGNAVKFVAKGVRPRVRVWANSSEARANRLVRISIQDNGIGIPSNARNRLFGMFERLTSEYEGTGIGLAIVRKVVDRMGGRVGIDSEPGKGSRFWVELKAAAGNGG
jgi:PAS domain S-box-containing protein